MCTGKKKFKKKKNQILTDYVIAQRVFVVILMNCLIDLTIPQIH